MTHPSFPTNQLLFLSLAWSVSTASALVNPTLQPPDLFDRYEKVVLLKTVSVDAEKNTLTLEVTGLAKGEFPAKQVILTATGDSATGAMSALATPGVEIVAYAVGKRRSAADTLLFCQLAAGSRMRGLELPCAAARLRTHRSRGRPG